jgi:hypothetical protein
MFLYIFQEVNPNSPADLAGLKSHTDYIIGADSVLHEVINSLCYKQNHTQIILLEQILFYMR